MRKNTKYSEMEFEKTNMTKPIINDNLSLLS